MRDKERGRGGGRHHDGRVLVWSDVLWSGVGTWPIVVLA